MASEVVPEVTRLAAAVREAGGIVIWIQSLAPQESERSWSVLKERFTPDNAEQRWQDLQPQSDGFALYPQLDVHAGDRRVVKRRYSAFIQGSSDIELVLRDAGIDTLIVAGVATNVCCDSTARDAMMLNYRALMVSDGCAAATDTEHATALGNFYLYFGDVQSCDEVIARLAVSGRRNAQ